MSGKYDDINIDELGIEFLNIDNLVGNMEA